MKEKHYLVLADSNLHLGILGFGYKIFCANKICTQFLHFLADPGRSLKKAQAEGGEEEKEKNYF